MAQAQVQLLESVKQDEEGLNIGYTSFKLANGLTVLVHEDHSSPIVHVDVTYHVGSSREVQGRSGFAHFFEHMMFEGSRHVEAGEHFKIISEAGGTLNATTNRDRTNYYETLPREYLETALWLESDRMGFLLDAVNQANFENQHSVIKNEKAQRYENRPYGMVRENMLGLLYPEQHPYSWPTIGFTEDLDRVGVEDLKQFFLRWYGPNNAVLTLAGDLDTEEAMELVEKYFSNLEQGPEVFPQPSSEDKLNKNKYRTLVDNVSLPLLQLTFPTVPCFHQEEAALDMLAQLIGGGVGSLLERELVRKKKVVRARAYHSAFEMAGEFSIQLYAYPNTDLTKLEKEVKAVIHDWIEKGISQVGLAKAKATFDAGFRSSLQKLSNKASRLAYYQTFYNRPDYLTEDLMRYQVLALEDITGAYQRYLSDRGSVVISVVPPDGKEITRADSPVKARSATPSSKSYDLALRNVEAEAFRQKQPKARKPKSVDWPVVNRQVFDNGLRSAWVQKPGSMAEVLFSIESGSSAEPPSNEGMVSLLAKLWREGSDIMPTDAFNNELELLGAYLSIDAGRNSLLFRLTVPKEKLEPAVDLFQQLLFQPRLSNEDFDRLKAEQLELIKSNSKSGAWAANKALYAALYGKQHPLGHPVIGTYESIEGISPDVLRLFREQVFQPSNCLLVVAGGLGYEELSGSLRFFKQWHAEKQELPVLVQQAQPEFQSTTIFLKDKPGAAQSEIRIGAAGLAFDWNGEFYSSGVVNYPFGGYFNSRLNSVLREEKGYTYGVRSALTGFAELGHFAVSTSVKTEFTKDAIEEILKQISAYKKAGPTKDELEKAKKALARQEALKYQTNSQLAAYALTALRYDMPEGFKSEQMKVLSKLKPKAAKQLAANVYPVQTAIVVVGNKAELLEELGELEYELIELGE